MQTRNDENQPIMMVMIVFIVFRRVSGWGLPFFFLFLHGGLSGRGRGSLWDLARVLVGLSLLCRDGIGIVGFPGSLLLLACLLLVAPIRGTLSQFLGRVEIGEGVDGLGSKGVGVFCKILLKGVFLVINGQVTSGVLLNHGRNPELSGSVVIGCESMALKLQNLGHLHLGSGGIPLKNQHLGLPAKNKKKVIWSDQQPGFLNVFFDLKT